MADFTLQSKDGESLKIAITAAGSSLEIRIDGYGEFSSTDGTGCPIVIDFYEGRPRLLVWADINREDYTHAIELEAAAEANRYAPHFNTLAN